MTQYTGPYRNQALHGRVMAAFEAVPEHIRDDIVEASAWARETLTNHEGAGHCIYVSAASRGRGVVCSFAKPEWGGDHCSQPRDHGAEAIVLAVVEYLNGA